MNFKEALQHDMERVFMNMDEFAETALFCGEQIPMIVNYTDSLEWQNSMPGLPRENVTLFFLEKDFSKDSALYEQGNSLEFQGKDWIVESVKKDMGMVELKLSKEKVGFI